MPRGLDKIKQVAKDNAAKRAAYDAGGGGMRKLSLKDGETAKVRFLEQGGEVWMLWAHQLPKQPGQRYGDWVWCLDQEDKGLACAACERNVSRSGRVLINVIWYGAPKAKKDANGKLIKDDNGNYIPDGFEDTLAVWHRGSNDGGRLEYLDSQYGGLTNHIFRIHRQGSTKDDTQYMIDMDQLNAAPTPPESELYKKKPDPRLAVKQMNYGDMSRAYSGGGVATENTQAGMGQPSDPNADLSGNVFAQQAAGTGIKRGAFGV